MGAAEIIAIIISGLTASKGLIETILQTSCSKSAVLPYLDLGFIGIRYCQKFLKAYRNPEALEELMAKSPNDLWKDAEDTEIANRLIRQAQFDRIGLRD